MIHTGDSWDKDRFASCQLNEKVREVCEGAQLLLPPVIISFNDELKQDAI